VVAIVLVVLARVSGASGLSTRALLRAIAPPEQPHDRGAVEEPVQQSFCQDGRGEERIEVLGFARLLVC
jgi:hypothetical protein